MKQADFERRHAPLWERCESLLATPAQDGASLPAVYRQVCAHLALAKQRRYTPELVARLNDLAGRGYFALYGASRKHQRLWLRFFVVDFPAAVARNRRFVLAAALLFILPGLGLGLAAWLTEDAIYSFFGASQVREFEAMYDPANARVGRDRDSQDDWQMFGFYIYNNIGIAFRTFATGLLFGAGSAFFLVYNGLAIGGVMGHLTRAGYAVTFYPFVIGHGAFELTAIVLSGAAGLRLGSALLLPGNRSRLGALRQCAPETAVIIYGAAAMLVVAAALEAFWSSRTSLPAGLRIGVGGVLWCLVIAYLATGGRRAA
ncbi:stage II sporulation protein M [Mangrovimicrobium sediminis]|uniref:Stage II sporulation protein M n=1 Tax=Mangrovimicrobium sediminis TaxID=2562682 RepID=A0A4Z0M816_9GAMM|nr:stage II sporulation protein M [Haliea sp. SAOS-164]TGD75823.1 stage II sporulation protein M [Haliea sp. SAOS-164]